MRRSGFTLFLAALAITAPALGPACGDAPPSPRLSPWLMPGAALTPPSGLDLSGVKTRSAVAVWDVDRKGKLRHVHVTPTGSRVVDAALADAVRGLAVAPVSVDGRPVAVEYAHVFHFAGTGDAEAAPMSSPSNQDISEDDMEKVVGKTVTVRVIVDEQGEVSDTAVIPAEAQDLARRLTDNFIARYLPPVALKGVPTKKMSFTFHFARR